MPISLSAPLLAIALFVVTFAVNLQAPLYGVYAANSGLGAAAVTVAFAAYVVGLMPTLLLLGGLSDRIGRRTPIAAALILGAAGTAMLALHPTWTSLVVARVLLGIATALATTSGTAYMTEIMGAEQTERAALFVTSATSLGFGGGALATGISLGMQNPTTAPLSFVVLFVVAPVLAALVLALPRVDEPKRASMIRLPVFLRETRVFGIAMALAWSTTGMTIAVVPLSLEAHGLGGWTGLVIFLAIFVGFLCQPIVRRMPNSKALAIGFLLSPLGFIILLFGDWSDALSLVLIGASTTSAASYGFTYLAALSEVSLRAPNDRARAVAGLFVLTYVGFSLPIVATGVAGDLFGLRLAMLIFASVQSLATLATVMFWIKKSDPKPIPS